MDRLVKAPQSDIFICGGCNRTIFNLIDCGTETKTAEKKMKGPSKTNPDTGAVKGRPVNTPAEIHRHLDRYAIGQDGAKKTLSVAVYDYGKRLKNKSGLIKKSDILLIGPSGCGKTLLAKILDD